MRIVGKEHVDEPIRNPLGEVIYEMIGAPEELGGTKGHSFVVVEIPPGGSSSEHYHRKSEETYYIVRGRARIVIDGEEFQVKPGDAILIQPPERHRIFNTGAETVEFVAVCAPPWVPEDWFSHNSATA